MLDELTARRASRSFGVEQPGLAPLSPDLQSRSDARSAGTRAERSTRSIDWTTDSKDRDRVAARATSPVIGPYFRGAAAEVSRPIVRQSLRWSSRSAGTRSALDNASNEESLIAANARLAFGKDSAARASSLAVLSSAVAVRTLAQATPWFRECRARRRPI